MELAGNSSTKGSFNNLLLFALQKFKFLIERQQFRSTHYTLTLANWRRDVKQKGQITSTTKQEYFFAVIGSQLVEKR